MIADSGVLALQPAAVPEDEDDESGAWRRDTSLGTT